MSQFGVFILLSIVLSFESSNAIRPDMVLCQGTRDAGVGIGWINLWMANTRVCQDGFTHQLTFYAFSQHQPNTVECCIHSASYLGNPNINLKYRMLCDGHCEHLSRHGWHRNAVFYLPNANTMANLDLDYRIKPMSICHGKSPTIPGCWWVYRSSFDSCIAAPCFMYPDPRTPFVYVITQSVVIPGAAGYDVVTAPHAGTVDGLVLAHESGGIRYRNGGAYHKWGHSDLFNIWVTADVDNPAADVDENFFFPAPSFRSQASRGGDYQWVGYDSRRTNVWHLHGRLTDVNAGQRFRIYYGEVLFDYTTHDNGGATIVHAYFTYRNSPGVQCAEAIGFTLPTGGNTREILVPHYNSCKRRCFARNDCYCFSAVAAEHGRMRCTLKLDGICTLTNNAGGQSGLCPRHGQNSMCASFRAGVDIIGTSYWNDVVDSADECKGRCMQDLSCRCFAFDPSRGNRCWLKNTNPCSRVERTAESADMTIGICPWLGDRGLMDRPASISPFESATLSDASYENTATAVMTKVNAILPVGHGLNFVSRKEEQNWSVTIFKRDLSLHVAFRGTLLTQATNWWDDAVTWANQNLFNTAAETQVAFALTKFCEHIANALRNNPGAFVEEYIGHSAGGLFASKICKMNPNTPVVTFNGFLIFPSRDKFVGMGTNNDLVTGGFYENSQYYKLNCTGDLLSQQGGHAIGAFRPCFVTWKTEEVADIQNRWCRVQSNSGQRIFKGCT